jgi:hypothetical protein
LQCFLTVTFRKSRPSSSACGAFPSLQGDEDLVCLWDVGKKLWNGQFAEIYDVMSSHQWPPHLSVIMVALRAALQTRLLNLIGKSYTLVKVGSVLDMTGLTKEQLDQEADRRKWQFNEDINTIVITQSAVPDDHSTTPQEMLGQLAKAVSFLEC